MGELIKVEEIGTANFDVQMVIANNVKVELMPTGDPTIWTYVDTNHGVPNKNAKEMNEKEIKTIRCLPEHKADCQLKMWECVNTSFKLAGKPNSTSPEDFYIWPKDYEIVHQKEFKKYQ